MNEPNRIYFIGNPYPRGHALEDFLWSGRIDEDESMWFDFHLQTDSYYDGEFNEEDALLSTWKSKGMWCAYGECTLSSTRWGDYGIKINKTSGKAFFNDFIKDNLLADTLPRGVDFDYDKIAFGIYLIGHDRSANHKIKIKETSKNKFDIEWSGKIALTYTGESGFNYDFFTHLQNTEFDGFHYPKTWSIEKASDFFKDHFEDFEEYEFVELNSKNDNKEYKFKKK
ncbi:hypothetical protein ACFFLS_05880 [Flavobacterium procerum]|uniref:Uncharacterized protein n=1 Tax=Flavobacterium procerum TaxID=1455569 RepID=A0ABV6BNN2_9FLAO